MLPADHKWFARLAVTEILTRVMIEMDLRWPAPDWDPAEQRRLLAETMSSELLAESLAETRGVVQEAIDAGVDVNLEAIELLTARSNQTVRNAAVAEVKARRAVLEADLAKTLADKREVLESKSPELAEAYDEAAYGKGKKSDG